MPKLIDTHLHLAWDIDDGFDCIEDAQKALKHMQEDGICSIIATPHVVPGQMDADMHETMKNRMLELKDIASDYQIAVHSGCEIFLNHEYMDLLEQNLYFSLADSNYVLVEFDVRKNIENNIDVEDILYEFTVRDKVPLIAHVERYFHESMNLKRVQEWIDMGCYVQVNRTSILGMHGSSAQKNAELLLSNNLVHIVASDGHRVDGNRVCKLSDIYEDIEKKYGKETADILTYKNPLHILNNEKLETIQVIKKTSRFKLWRR